MPVTKRPKSKVWNRTAHDFMTKEKYWMFVDHCERMDEKYRLEHPEKTENQLYIHASAGARELAHLMLGRDLYFALERPVTAEELLTEFQLKYMCDTVSLGTMKKVVKTCEEDSKIPKLTAGTLSKRIAKKPTKLEQERIAMLLNRG